MASTHFVQFLFADGARPSNSNFELALMQLAFKSASANGIKPRMVLVRCLSPKVHLHRVLSYLPGSLSNGTVGHTSTSSGGVLDEHHFLFSFKTDEQVADGTHVTCHAYTPGPMDYTLNYATIRHAKSDTTPVTYRRKKPTKGRTSWPALSQLTLGENIPFQIEDDVQDDSAVPQQGGA